MPHPNSVLLLRITACRTGGPNLGQSLQFLLGLLCHLEPCLLQLAPAMHEVVVVSHLHLQWRLPVFPNNTKSQTSHVLVSFPETRWWTWWGTSKCLRVFWAILAAWWSEGVVLSLEVNSRLLIIYITQFGGHWHTNSGHELKLQISPCSLAIMAHAKKLGNKWACSNCIFSMVSWRSIYLPPMDSLANVGTLPTSEKVLTSLLKPPDWQFKGWSWTTTV